MGKFDIPLYDEPRKWIQKRRENGKDWDSIKLACKASEEKLMIFLESRIEEDDWPELNVSLWKELVSEVEDFESKQENFKFKGNDGALFDTDQDNGLTVPQNERSSWQLYRNSLGWKNVQDLEDATHGILKRLSTDTSVTGPVKGLVVGHVQSGKTANMEALMAMAADHGWNFFIILSGTIENLRLQTLKRIQNDLNKEGNIIWRGLEHPSKKSQYGDRAQDFHFEPGAQSRYFTVCLKNASRLKKLIDWIHEDRASHDQMKILIIDDEADQASVANNVRQIQLEAKERKGINKLIVNLVNDEHYRKGTEPNGKAAAVNYVMYTATPYANFLNEATPESLYPSNFIWTLKTSDEYIGPVQIYGSNDPDSPDGLDITRIVDEDDLECIKDIYEGYSSELPESMKDSICWFICAAAVMRYQGYTKPISMLVHTSQKQICHSAVADAVSKWINGNMKSGLLVKRCRNIYEYETERLTKDQWLSQFPGYGVPSEEIRDYPSFEEILPDIELLLSESMKHIKLNETGDFEYHKGIHLVIDNCSQNGVTSDNEYIRLAYPDPDKRPYPSPAPAFIIVGGSTLSRGLTIEGLVCTFFLRASCQADTLMQMGRWFGYRKKYELLPRIWMTEDTMDKFRFLSNLETDLRDDLKKYMLTEVTPSEYGPRILCSPKVSWLRITSKNHSFNAFNADMDFSGAKPQTVVFDGSEEIQKNNIRITEEFLESLGPCDQVSYDGTSVCWKQIPLKTIMDRFLLNGFHFSERSRVFNEIESFCTWIKKVSEENELSAWNVIVSGNCPVGTGNAENEKQWCVDGKIIGKANRSRRIPLNEAETSIDIGILRALKDHIADIPPELIQKYKSDYDFDPGVQNDVDAIRKYAEMDKIPLLIIYRIYSKSVNMFKRADRMDMNRENDIIGIQICVPGDQVNSKFCKRMTVSLPDKNLEDMIEELIEEPAI